MCKEHDRLMISHMESIESNQRELRKETQSNFDRVHSRIDDVHERIDKNDADQLKTRDVVVRVDERTRNLENHSHSHNGNGKGKFGSLTFEQKLTIIVILLAAKFVGGLQVAEIFGAF